MASTSAGGSIALGGSVAAVFSGSGSIALGGAGTPSSPLGGAISLSGAVLASEQAGGSIVLGGLGTSLVYVTGTGGITLSGLATIPLGGTGSIILGGLTTGFAPLDINVAISALASPRLTVIGQSGVPIHGVSPSATRLKIAGGGGARVVASGAEGANLKVAVEGN